MPNLKVRAKTLKKKLFYKKKSHFFRQRWNINMKESYVIADSLVDKNLARNAKLKYVNVNKNTDLLKIVKKICN